MLQEKPALGYHVLKIGKFEYDALNICKRVDRILSHFQKSEISSPDFDLFNQVVDFLWRNGNYEEALTVVRAADEKYPEGIDLVQKEGEILLDAGYLDDTVDLFRQLKISYPDQYQVMENLGYALEKRGKQDEAEKILEDVLVMKTWDPSHLMAQFSVMEVLARIFYSRGQYEKALEYIEEILMIQPRASKWKLYLNILKRLNRDQDLEEAEITWGRIKKARRYASRASKYENQLRLELALKNYHKALEENPYEPHYYFSIASTLEKLPEEEYEFQFEEATGYYKKAREMFPNNPFYAISYVDNLVTVNQWEEALEEGKKAARKFPELMLPGLRNICSLLGRSGEYLSIVGELNELEDRHELPELRVEMGLLLKDRGDKKSKSYFEDASEIYIKKIDLHPYNWRNYYRNACCQMELGNLRDARTHFIKSLELHSDFSVDIGERLSDCLYKSGMYEDARLLLEALVLSNPGDYDYLGKMGLCFIACEDYERAFEAFNRSIKINPNIPEYLYGAGVSAAHLDYSDDAINLIKDLLDINDGFVEVIEEEPAFTEMERADDFFDLVDEVKERREKRREESRIESKTEGEEENMETDDSEDE